MTRPMFTSRLPDFLRSFFWDNDFKDLPWEEDQDLISKHIRGLGENAKDALDK